MAYILASIGSYFCDSNIKYIWPFIFPLNPLNLIHIMFLAVIFLIVFSIPPNFTNSSNKKNRSFGRSVLVSGGIYYVATVSFYFMILLLFCGAVKKIAPLIPTPFTFLNALVSPTNRLRENLKF